MTGKPSVLFVCVKNGGKSQMAAGLMTKRAGDMVQVDSAGTSPGNAVNQLSAESLAEVGVDISGETPKLITDEMVRQVDLVVTLGREAHVDEVPGTAFENWDTDEPSERGIGGMERMRLVRDDIAGRIDELYGRLTRQALTGEVPSGNIRVVSAASTVFRAAAPTPIKVADAGPHQSP